MRRRAAIVPAPAKATNVYLFADLSANNGGVFDARAYRSAGHIAIALKATQGTKFVDPRWSERTTAAHTHRVAVCHYHFCQLDNPVSEARHFWDTVRPRFNHHVDRLAIDLEIGEEKDWPHYLTELDTELIRLSGQHAIGYTFASALNRNLRVSSGLWWAAAWGPDRPATPGAKLWGWQYASPPYDPSHGPASAVGIAERCDMSVMRPVTVARIQKGAKVAWPGR